VYFPYPQMDIIGSKERTKPSYLYTNSGKGSISDFVEFGS